jgi:hypothetical protein
MNFVERCMRPVLMKRGMDAKTRSEMSVREFSEYRPINNSWLG